MLVNADFTRPVIVAPDDYRWAASPQAGVERMMLDRLGAEKVRATSIVRYASASHFPLHAHPGGEEILVLSGVFSDSDGDYPAGWYLRNPPGSSHRPFTSPGAIIFVKLWQIAPSEAQSVRIDTRSETAWRRSEDRDVCALFSGESEEVSILRLTSNARVFNGPVGSAEVLVISGSTSLDGHQYRRGAWMRFPVGAAPDLAAGPLGACVYVKTGHLINVGLKE